jgi:hypothetical protein
MRMRRFFEGKIDGVIGLLVGMLGDYHLISQRHRRRRVLLMRGSDVHISFCISLLSATTFHERMR